MSDTKNPLRIATRQSALALWQAEHVAMLLRRVHPTLPVVLVPMTTRGDQVLDRPLAEIGGKGLFLKELEVAMAEGRADIAVHSLKDVPMELEPGFVLTAILAREDPADAFVSRAYAHLDELPHGARVGTSSLRRQAQLRATRGDLRIADLRGNVNTRLAKLDAGEFDAVVLACAGLLRLGFGERIRSRLQAPQWLAAAGQGAIAIECRAGDERTHALTRVLDDAPTATCVAAERAMTRELQGSCQVPIAAQAVLHEGELRLAGLVGDAATGRLLRAEAHAGADEAQALGERVAALLLDQGAGALLGR
ncbi:MAG TPA: hydroxymethylbilane synthase [Xanthomonadales bacterium]|nr:hydroxymethylbilane synthase [Xanthomonadales bacterium]